METEYWEVFGYNFGAPGTVYYFSTSEYDFQTDKAATISKLQQAIEEAIKPGFECTDIYIRLNVREEKKDE